MGNEYINVISGSGRRMLVALALLAVAISARAQSPGAGSSGDGISNQLEVTRAYTPKVGKATKLPVEPDMTDTVRLRPEISYRITPKATATTFRTSPFAPAAISAAPFEKDHPLYVRFGAGFPLQSTADVYFTPRVAAGSSFGIFANHRGSFSKIENEFGVKPPSMAMSNRAGLFGSRQMGRYALSGDLIWDHRYFEPYGVADVDVEAIQTILPPVELPPPDVDRQFSFGRRSRISLGKVEGNVGFGDDFTDLSRLNFRVDMRLGYGWGGSDQADVDVSAAFAKMLNSKHGFSLDVRERGAVAIDDSRMTAITVVLTPRYLLRTGNFRLSAGLDVSWMHNPAHLQGQIAFAPVAEGSISLADGRFVPFFSLSSELLDGSFEALSRRNPYLIPGRTAPTGWSHDLRLGISGGLSGGLFSYGLHGGISFLDNYHLFIARQEIVVNPVDFGETDYAIADFSPAMFGVGSVNGTRFALGAEVGLHDLGGFSARLYGDLNRFSLNTGNYLVGDLPRYDAGMELSWRHKDKLTLSAGARLVGDREFNNTYSITGLADRELSGSFVTTVGPVVDISLGAEAKVSERFWLWIEGRNLAGQNLYPHSHYRGLGANVMVGVKAVF